MSLKIQTPLTPLRNTGKGQAEALSKPTPKRDRPCDGVEESPTKRQKSNVQDGRSPFKPLHQGSVKPGGGRSPIKGKQFTPQKAAEVARLQTPNKTQAKILEDTLVIYDYDDTLFPSSFLSNLSEVYWDTRDVPQSLLEMLAQIEDEMISILDQSIELVGPERVAIITNAEEGWIELSSAKYMPRLLKTMKKCRMLSARSLFAKYVPDVGPFEWKLYAFQFMLEACFGMRFPRPDVKQMKLTQSNVESVLVDSSQDFSTESDQGLDKENSDPVLPAALDSALEVTPETSDEPECGPLTKQGRYEVEDDEEDAELSQEDAELSLDGHSPWRNSNHDVSSQDSTLWDDVQEGFKLSGTAAGNNQMAGNDDTSADVDTSIEDGEIEQKVEYMYLPSDAKVEFPEIPDDVLCQHGLGYKEPSSTEKTEKLNKLKYIFSLGDSLAEKVAARHLSDSIPGMVVKTVKWVDRPNLEQLLNEARLIKDEIQKLIRSEQSLDVSVSVPVYYDTLVAFQDKYYEEKAAIEAASQEEIPEFAEFVSI